MAAMPDEVWRPIPGAKGIYEASSLGRIRSVDRIIERVGRHGAVHQVNQPGRTLRPWFDGNGYQVVYICVDGARTAVNVHRLVAQAFLEGDGKGLDVNHIDGVKTNNASSNLEWCTRQENMHHARKAGLLRPIRGYIATPIVGGPEMRFASETEAAKAVGAAKRGNISSAANGKLRQAYGYYWRHAA